MSDGLGRLWAGWRSSYVGAAEPADGCVLCRVTAPDADAIWRGETCVAILNAFPYTSGHLMVMPQRHVADLEDLTSPEAAELWGAVRDGVVALKAAYHPGGINVGANLGRSAGAGIPGHLHFHAVPRWNGDTNFMTTVGGVRVLPEDPDETLEKLRAAWPGLATGTV